MVQKSLTIAANEMHGIDVDMLLSQKTNWAVDFTEYIIIAYVFIHQCVFTQNVVHDVYLNLILVHILVAAISNLSVKVLTH